MNKYLFKETTEKKIRKKLNLNEGEINVLEEGLVDFLRHYVVNIDFLEKKMKINEYLS